MVRTIIEDKTAIINIEKNIISENVDILEDKLSYAKNVGALNFIFDFYKRNASQSSFFRAVLMALSQSLAPFTPLAISAA